MAALISTGSVLRERKFFPYTIQSLQMKIDKQVYLTLADCPRQVLLTLKGLTEYVARVKEAAPPFIRYSPL